MKRIKKVYLLITRSVKDGEAAKRSCVQPKSVFGGSRIYQSKELHKWAFVKTKESNWCSVDFLFNSFEKLGKRHVSWGSNEAEQLITLACLVVFEVVSLPFKAVYMSPRKVTLLRCTWHQSGWARIHVLLTFFSLFPCLQRLAQLI
jgi:hypothetical protein